MQQAAHIEVRPDHTTITYSHIGFTIRQIMFSPDGDRVRGKASTGPVVLFQIDANQPMDLIFRFTPEMRWMWPKRNDGIPSPEWVPAKAPSGTSLVAEPGQQGGEGFYALHMDYPDLAGAVTIPTATPGIVAPYQERPQVHPMELHLHYDPKRDGRGLEAKYFPLLMAAGLTKETATNEALGVALAKLQDSVAAAYTEHAARYAKMFRESTSIETPDMALNEAFQWGVASIEQLKAHPLGAGEDTGGDAGVAAETALVAGYFASGDSARPGFGWFFGRDSLFTLYAVNGFGDFALTRAELEFLMARQRADGKIMHEFAQTAGDPSVNWKSFEYMYAAADATPLFLMAARDYLRASGDIGFLEKHREAIEKAWAFETAASSDSDHDGIYDNSQGTGWVESWLQGDPHQEVYLALLDEQASRAYEAIETALKEPSKAEAAEARAASIQSKIEAEYYEADGCYAFSHNANGSMDKAKTVYPAIAWWDEAAKAGAAPLAHPEGCLRQFAEPTMATDWGLRDVDTSEAFYDGMSYHQGSVWPLFTGWGALAEYRGGQPLAGQQMLMQNVDLTWAQDPGAVTELLSGDFFVPFGRSTSHQLWSSAMVITPVLRGMFGISLDATTNTITVNPHVPGDWKEAKVNGLHLGGKMVDLVFSRQREGLRVSAGERGDGVRLRSDLPGATSGGKGSELVVPLPAVEVVLPKSELPTPGSRPAQPKVLTSVYGARRLTLTIAGLAGTEMKLGLLRNLAVEPKVMLIGQGASSGAKVSLTGEIEADGPRGKDALTSRDVSVSFPKAGDSKGLATPGGDWQTVELTLSW